MRLGHATSSPLNPPTCTALPYHHLTSLCSHRILHHGRDVFLKHVDIRFQAGSFPSRLVGRASLGRRTVLVLDRDWGGGKSSTCLVELTEEQAYRRHSFWIEIFYELRVDRYAYPARTGMDDKRRL